MRKIVFCGDSFLAGVNEDWSWPVRVAKDLNLEIENLAIVGASNFNIYHQVLHATKNLKYDFEHIIICLTAPNRIESVKSPLSEKLNYNHFKSGEIVSWALHERVEWGELSLQQAEELFDYNIAVEKDRVFVDKIVQMADWSYKSIIFSNLFEQYTKHPAIQGGPKDISDVVTGELDEPVSGHLYKSSHDKFYNYFKDQLLYKLT